MKRIAVVLLIFFLHVAAFGQTVDYVEVNVINHQVTQGETVRLISQKYLVTPADIYRLNKFAVDGISQGMVLQIPFRGKAAALKPVNNELENEIAEIEEIQKALAADGDKEAVAGVRDASENVKLDVDDPQHGTVTNSTKFVEHKVLPGETLSALSRKYGVTIDAIKRENPNLISHVLHTGQVVRITSNVSLAKTSPHTNVANDNATSEKPNDIETVEHKVEAKETLFSISRRYDISVDEIKMQNPTLLAHGLQTGQVIKIKLKK